MKAILLNEVGGIENLIYSDVEKPTLEKGEVLVKVEAIGINQVDYICRENDEFLTYVFKDKRPIILGWDISGEIVEKAEGTDGFKVGNSVFGMLEFSRGGAYAEYAVASINNIVHKPENITHQEAASTGIAALTAWQAVVTEGKVKKGEKILIHGGSGGVGHFAVQIAKSFGAEVIAISSGKNRNFVLSLGADTHIDYKTQHFYEEVNGLDVVFDTVGGDTLSHSIDCVKEGGRIVTVIPTLTEAHKEKAKAKNVHLDFMECHASGADMGSVADLLEKGAIKPYISDTYLFSEMGKAHKSVETGHTVGKVVVTV